ncbi:uncharacterized protein LOC131685804 [Topomyia yanbarensis]|uniref:uncharacterized protein LOC131685804 n=1 Tax=Topomyia yanbarensis TaxID=2498891 RepID=UPI00273C264F|nr:uncharacterized protein LOC131685804 [Topomyia yanbarensis]
MANQKDQDVDLIRITHYINPHNFWFKHESAYLFNEEDQSFQMEINDFCETTYGRGNISTGVYTPRQKGELVAVFYFQLSRWVRAEVDEIIKELNGQVHCNLWAIDEGVPVKTSCQYIKPLPDRFASTKTSVKHGGLERILPAESGYNYLEGKTVTKMIQDWSPGVVRVFETCIEEAVSIRFCDIRQHQVTEIDMYFGTMKITSHQNVTNNATDLLKKAGGEMVMLVDQAEFYDKMPLLRTLDIRRFEDNDRNESMKYYTNTFRPEYPSHCVPRQTEKSRFRNNYIIEQAREKFLEWDKRNTASSVVTTNAVSDYLPTNTPVLPNVSAVLISKSKDRKSTELEYSKLVNESFSDEEEPPKVEFEVPVQIRQAKPAEAPKTIPDIPHVVPAYQRPQNRTYDKNVSDLLPALNKIKLRRAPVGKQSAMAENTFNSTRATVGAPSVLNIVPAGFNLGNVDFSTGSVILGADRTSNMDDGRSMANHLHRESKQAVNFRAKLRKHRKPQHSANDQDSSFEEMMVRKMTFTATKADNEIDEQW